MKSINWFASLVLATGLTAVVAGAWAHESGHDGHPDGMIVTRHFSGIWDQVDQEAQGLAIQVVEQFDDSRKSVAYWYTYGADRKTAWFVGTGDLVENRIELELFESDDVGFMQDNDAGSDSVESIGSMVIVFESCDGGSVTFDTSDDEVGSGSFRIERLLQIMNTHCTGGISDDMHIDGMFGEQYLALEPAREGITGEGRAKYEDFPGHMEFEVKVEDLPDGAYHLHVGMRNRGDFTVSEGRGEIKYASPAEDGHMPFNFDPRGRRIEVYDDAGVVLSSFDNMMEEDDHRHHGYGDGDQGWGDHDYDCDSDSHHGGGPGGGPGSGPGSGPGGGHGGRMPDCVEDGDYVEIEVDMKSTGVLPGAEGEAEWEMNSSRVEFSVEIEDVPEGNYGLEVAGIDRGTIEAFRMHDGDVHGRITFRDPEVPGREPLDFDPRGQMIQVLQGDQVILEVQFPME
jgi:hypothetical protein